MGCSSNASGASVKFNIRIEFVANTVNVPDIVRGFRCDLEFMPEVTDMIIDCPAGIAVEIFVPHKVYDHVVSEYSAWIHNEQGKDVKFLHRQHNLSFTDAY